VGSASLVELTISRLEGGCVNEDDRVDEFQGRSGLCFPGISREDLDCVCVLVIEVLGDLEGVCEGLLDLPGLVVRLDDRRDAVVLSPVRVYRGGGDPVLLQGGLNVGVLDPLGTVWEAFDAECEAGLPGVETLGDAWSLEGNVTRR